MQIQSMSKECLTAVAELESLCFSAPWNEKMLEEELENPYSHFLTVREKNQVVGYLGCHMIEGEGYIANVAVNPANRRKGIGRALIQRLQQDAVEKRLVFLTLEVRSSNISAQALYINCGFEKVGIRKKFYTHPAEDAVIMTYKVEV